MKENNSTAKTVSLPQSQPAQEVKLALQMGKILDNSRRDPKNYVKEWIVPGGGE